MVRYIHLFKDIGSNQIFNRALAIQKPQDFYLKDRIGFILGIEMCLFMSYPTERSQKAYSSP